MRHVLRRHTFLLLGVLLLGLFYLVAAFDGAGKTDIAAALAVPMRILIVPIYLVSLLLTAAMAGPHGFPMPFATIVWGIEMVAGLAPYALVDYLLERRRLARNRD